MYMIQLSNSNKVFSVYFSDQNKITTVSITITEKNNISLLLHQEQIHETYATNSKNAYMSLSFQNRVCSNQLFFTAALFKRLNTRLTSTF